MQSFDLKVQKIRNLRGKVKAPPSKSYTLRAIIVGCINGRVRISNPLLSDDTRNAIELWKKLGATIQEHGRSLQVTGFGNRLSLNPKNGNKSKFSEIYVGESGTLLRFILPILALLKGKFRVIGKDTLCDRPNAPIVQALKGWGVNIEGYGRRHELPIKIISNGTIKGGKTTVNGSMSSQTISSLLIAAPFTKNGTEIKVENLKLVSRPYIDITHDVLKWAKVNIKRNGYKSFTVKNGQKIKPGKVFHVHGDYSSAAFLMAAACLVKSDVTITDLVNDKQGDKEIIKILRKMGARILNRNKSVRIRGPFNLRGIEIDCRDIPDLVPILAVLGCFAKGKTRLYNIEHVAHKESDRISHPAKELCELGASISRSNKELFIKHSKLRSGKVVSSHGDHRVVMALAVAGLAIGNLTIKNARCISKSYPDFISDLKSLGAKLGKAR